MTPETIQRSPLSYEICEPTKATDHRGLEDQVNARVQGRREHSNCGSEQLLENNDLLGHPVMEAAETDPLRLFMSEERPPNFAIVSEKPEHRLIVYLKARGMSNREVSAKTGYSEPWVSQIVRQPWFRLRIVQELKEAGMDEVGQLLKSSCVDSIFTLLEIRDDSEAPRAVRRQAADSLLDRYLGKPTVHVAHESDRTPSTPEISAVDTELAAIEQQLKEQHGKQSEVQH